VPALARTLHGEDIWARQPAAWALWQMGQDAEPATDALIRALGAGWAGSAYGANSGYHAAHALAEIGKPAVSGLIEVFKGRNNTRQRRAAAVALGLIGPDARDAIPALTEALTNEAPLVRSDAALALAKIAPNADGVIKVLAVACGDADYGVRNNVVKALGLCASKNASAIAPLAEALADKHKAVCYAAYRSLGQGGKASVRVLIKALKSDDPWRRKYAARALGDAARGAADAAALNALLKLLSDRDAEVRREAVWSLGLVGPKRPGLADGLKALFRDDDHVVRVAARTVLEGMR
jgi:HEAT repeat protein